MDVHSPLARRIRRQPVLKEALRHVLTRVQRYRPGPLPDIAIVSCRRSGSTWLMELLAAMPGMTFVNEPFRESVVRAAGLPTPNNGPGPDDVKILDVPPGTEAAYRSFLNDPRQTRIRGPYRIFAPEFDLVATRRVLKEVLANGITGFIADEGFLVVHLLRHPIPTALSMGRTRRFLDEAFLRHATFPGRFLTPAQHALAEEIVASGDRLRRGVLEWCLANLEPLAEGRERSDGWVTLTYEELVLRPHEVLRAFAPLVRIDDPTPMLERLDVPSASTHPERLRHLQDTDAWRRITDWRRHIDDADEQAAFEVADAFGIDAYVAGSPLAARPYLLLDPTG